MQFRFYTRSDTELRMWAKGITEHGVDGIVEAKLRHRKTYGWPADGGGSVDGIVLKRMVSIGQDLDELKDVQWYETGAYFGHYAGRRQPLIRWSNMKIGRVDARGNPIHVVPWGRAQTQRAAFDFAFNYPDDPHRIVFSCMGCDGEANAIDLSKP